MRIRLLTIGLVLSAALADAAGAHELAYYALVAAVPLGSLAALGALGSVLDGSAVEPLDRVLAALSCVAVPFILLGAAVRAPLLDNNPPPTIGATCVLVCLALFALHALLSATASAPRTLRAAARAAK
ncbi:MAG: hypothetical protein MSC30_07960 [Gaiellaceae bacterium MAG52_C11]|nr:hypothetical protein [Candidatus Gaiellasilicea maunaloa]